MPYNIHCEKCGHEFEVEKWRPGLPCPKCQAGDTVPMTKMGTPGAPPAAPSFVDDSPRVAGAGWKNSPVVAGIAIAVIVVTWIILAVWKFKKPKAMQAEIWAVCTECDERVVKFGNEVPADCAKCGEEKTVYALYECKGEEGTGCGTQFAYMPPSSALDPYGNEADWENLSAEERDRLMAEMQRDMTEHEQAMMKASMCPKCNSSYTGSVFTDEQKKKFAKMQEEYEKKGKKK